MWSSNSVIPVIPSAGSTNSFLVRVMKNPTVAGPFWLTRGPEYGRGLVNLPSDTLTLESLVIHRLLSAKYDLFAGFCRVSKVSHMKNTTLDLAETMKNHPVFIHFWDTQSDLTHFFDQFFFAYLFCWQTDHPAYGDLSESRPKGRMRSGQQLVFNRPWYPVAFGPFSWFLVHFGRFEKPNPGWPYQRCWCLDRGNHQIGMFFHDDCSWFS